MRGRVAMAAVISLYERHIVHSVKNYAARHIEFLNTLSLAGLNPLDNVIRSCNIVNQKRKHRKGAIQDMQ